MTSLASTGREFTMAESQPLHSLEPCAATSSMFLYARGPNIFCCRHDSLAIERRFSRHSDDIRLLAVDNQSDHGSGRLIVSYDSGQTAIVWDLTTGDEVARFASYEPLTVAAWMKNGNLTFGNAQGSIIMFEPGTSEHLSTRTLDQIRVTALAPASDCRTFAIGYQNGSLLIATLQPRFVILHLLTTAPPPSPVITLAWHSSGSRQKADMLAAQMLDGDLRVWSVGKSGASDTARVVRVLRRTENGMEGPHWMGWSKNGRIIQYSDRQTVSWDVRTKFVTYDAIPTLSGVQGLALYGPGASLFTLGPAGSVQQFDLNVPSVMVANVTHQINYLPPSAPFVLDERSRQSPEMMRTSSAVPTMELHVTSSDEDRAVARRREMPSSSDQSNRYDTSSPSSSHSSEFSRPFARNPSVLSHQPSGITSISSTSASFTGHGPKLSARELDVYTASVKSPSAGSSVSKSQHRPSRLRNEVKRTARSGEEGSSEKELFKYTRARLSDLSYRHPAEFQIGRLTNDDLRRSMLRTIFGWSGDGDELVRDEMSQHPVGSLCRILLSKWVGVEETDSLLAKPYLLSPSDWMLLALTGGGPQSFQPKLAQAYVQSLLGEGDVHSAAAIMIAMGDQNDAIEVYISHRKYMEALLLTCVAFPAVWQRQAAIIKKWGEHSVLHGQQQLAIRCFACTDRESTGQWASPSAMQLNFPNWSIAEGIAETTSPAGLPGSLTWGPQRNVVKSASLKLITSFSNPAAKVKFFNDGQTPIAAGVTPILDTAISPNSHPNAAFSRSSGKSVSGSPVTARPADRLPSIGEGEGVGGEGKIGADVRSRVKGQDRTQSQPLPQAGGPEMEEESGRLPSLTLDVIKESQDLRSMKRNWSRDKLPATLKLQLQEPNDVMSPNQNRFHWPSRWRGGSVSAAGSSTSTGSLGGRPVISTSNRGNWASMDAPRTGSSTEELVEDKPSSRQKENGERGGTDSDQSIQSVMRSQNGSEDRGRTAERSRAQWARDHSQPTTAPDPNKANNDNNNDYKNIDNSKIEQRRVGSMGPVHDSETGHGLKINTSGQVHGGWIVDRDRDRERATDLDGDRDRDRDRGGERDWDGIKERNREPMTALPIESAPPPMRQHFEGSDDEREYQLATEVQKRWRKERSSSRARGEAKTSKAVTKAPQVVAHEQQGTQAGSSHRGVLELPSRTQQRAASEAQTDDLRKLHRDRDIRRHNALLELEERRKLLAQATAPISRHEVEIGREVMVDNRVDKVIGEASRSMYASRSKTLMGRLGTPKAMRLTFGSEGGKAPEVPEVPASVLPAKVFSADAEPDRPAAAATAAATESRTMLLPSTVYQPPLARPTIDRCASAPVPETMVPLRTGSAPPVQGTGVGSGNSSRYGSTVAAAWQQQWPKAVPRERRPSRSDQEPQQRTVPPPPPPPPHSYSRSHSDRTDWKLDGTVLVEIVDGDDGDDDDDPAFPPHPQQLSLPLSPPPLPPPPPPPPQPGREHSRASGSVSIGSSMLQASSRVRSNGRIGGAELDMHRGAAEGLVPLNGMGVGLQGHGPMMASRGHHHPHHPHQSHYRPGRDGLTSPGGYSVASTQGYSTGLTREELV